LYRFISADSVVQEPYDPQTLNRYSYVRNNPIVYTDPSGHFFTALIAGAIIGAISAGAESHWRADAVLAGALIGSVSAYTGAEVSALVGGGITGSVLGGVAAGSVAGGTAAAISKGDIAEGVFAGAVMGGIAGGVFGGIGDYYGGVWPLDRERAHGIAGGVLSATGGGIFAACFVLAIGLVVALVGIVKA